MFCALPPAALAFTYEKNITKGGCPSVVLLSYQSLFPHPFVLFWIDQVFAFVITALAKWPVRVCAAFQIENKSGETASFRRVTSIGCPLLLANSGAWWERVRERKRFSLNVFVWRRVTPPSISAMKAIKKHTADGESGNLPEHFQSNFIS